MTGSALFAEETCAPPPPCVFLPTARPCVENPCLLNQSDVYLQFSFLYWMAQERGLDYAIKNKTNQFDARGDLYQPSFDWEPAFRVVAGGYLPHDNWRLDFTYAFYLQTLEDSAKHNFIGNFGEGLMAVWTAPGAFSDGNIYARWELAETKWKLHANFFDLMLRNDLCSGKQLSFQPACGLKMALLQQRYSVTYSYGSSFDDQSFMSSKINLTNRSFNFGPSAGIGTRWCLSPYWNLNGYLGGALLASQFDLGRNEYDLSTTTIKRVGSYRFNRDFWTWRPQTTLLFGVEWSDCICSPDRVLHWGFKASYEMQYWWKQNMMLRHIDAPIVQSHTVASVQGDLMFQGLTVDIFFDF